MREHEQDGALTENGIDLAIAELLDEQPSGDFVARVRSRIDQQPARSPGVAWSRWMAGAAATALLIACAALWWMYPVVSTTAVLESPAVAEAPVIVATPPAAAPAILPRAVSTTRKVAGVPAVLVSPNEAAGLRFFMSALRNGHVEPIALPGDSGDADVPTPLVIEPIAVEPLLSAGDLEIGEIQ